MKSKQNIFYLHKMGLSIEQIARLIGEEEEHIREILFWVDPK